MHNIRTLTLIGVALCTAASAQIEPVPDTCMAQIEERSIKTVIDSTRDNWVQHWYELSPSHTWVMHLVREYHVQGAYIMDSMQLLLFPYCDSSSQTLVDTYYPLDSTEDMNTYEATMGWEYWSPSEEQLYLAVTGTTLNTPGGPRWLYLRYDVSSITLGVRPATTVRVRRPERDANAGAFDLRGRKAAQHATHANVLVTGDRRILVRVGTQASGR
jgi:hypothetical protein